MRALRVYVAGPFAQRGNFQARAADLRARGFEVTSTWHESTEEEVDEIQGVARDRAERDVRDLEAADVLLVQPTHGIGSGHHIETGMALALGKPVVAVGWTSIFHALGGVVVVSTYARAVPVLEGMRLGVRRGELGMRAR